ncbi:MAG: transcription elongation factor GreA [Elusimicrobia bacterium]|nr:transcription elongation factor GreA [Elusimicrobiota bacterium]
MSDYYITREGYEKLKKEIENLKKEKALISVEIGETREQGDLRENAGYAAARERQSLILKKMAEIENKLKSAKITDELNINTEEIRIGATVTLFDENTKNHLTYTLVTSDEADPAEGKISINSPLAQGLLGNKKQSSVKIKLPKTDKIFNIIEVEYK